MWSMISATSQSVFSILANFFVIYVILHHSHFIGSYKYILAAYCFNEALCAFVIAAVSPVHFVYDNTYIVFSTGSLVEGTELSKYASGIYCGQLLMWITFTLYQFLYRYVVVCHYFFYERIIQSVFLKAVIVFVAIIYPIYLLVCGAYWCSMAEISDTMNDQLLWDFNITNISHHGYMLMRLVNNDGSISVYGTLSTLNHYVAHGMATLGIIFCSVRIYWKLTYGLGVENIKQQRKLFRILLVQCVIPLFCVVAPSSLYISFPFWAPDNTYSYITPVMTCLLAMPKLLDPIVLILFIREYRKAVWAMLTGKRSETSIQPVSNEQSTKKGGSQEAA